MGQRLRAEVERRVDALWKDGGYILAPANHLQNDTPPENADTSFNDASFYLAQVAAPAGLTVVTTGVDTSRL